MLRYQDLHVLQHYKAVMQMMLEQVFWEASNTCSVAHQ